MTPEAEAAKKAVQPEPKAEIPEVTFDSWYLHRYSQLDAEYSSRNPYHFKREYIFAKAAWNAALEQRIKELEAVRHETRI